MTEIPEHLLNRSKARRSGGASESSDAPASNVPAIAESAKPAVAKSAPREKVAEPDSPVVVAAKSRHKIPFWAMAGLATLPVWAFIYLLALTPAEEEVTGPIATGIAAYSGCAGCHGAEGAGGAGQVLWEGESLKTFPHIEDMLNFVYTGSQAFQSAGIGIYGDPDREGGGRVPLAYNGNAMPAQGPTAGGALTEYEILGVVCHIRYDFSDADIAGEWQEEWEKWCAPESEIYAALRAGTTSFDTLDADFMTNVVGTKARATTAR